MTAPDFDAKARELLASPQFARLWSGTKEDAVTIIASALRSAHNDAIERAAVELETRAQWLMDNGDEYDPLIAKELREQAARLRGMKTQ